jgi:cyclohexa-1,5-dienecarbonyl-CoA hydratase
VSDYQFIRCEADGGLATITLAKPPYNVLDIPMMDELNDALDRLAAAPDVKVLSITGAGEKAFSAGVEVADHTPDKMDRMIEAFHGIFRRLDKFPVPTVAAVNGVALGGGCEVVLGCDMVVAVAGAKFGQPEIKLAVFPPVAAVLLPRLIPPARAMELLLGGNNIEAEEARALGLVNRVLPREEFAAGCRAFLEQFLGLSRAALASTRKAIREARNLPFNAALDRAESIYLKELMATADAKEGLAAFLEKRKPVWQNQ